LNFLLINGYDGDRVHGDDCGFLFFYAN